MRNRAKCRLCGDIIESFHPGDSIACKCGRMGVFGGPAMLSWADDYANFLRVDDLGNEIIVHYSEKADTMQKDINDQYPPEPFTGEDAVEKLNDLIKHVENLPESAKTEPVNMNELLYLMLVISAIFKKGDTHENK